MYEATLAALVIAERLIGDYEDLKRARSLLDFDDLIDRTAPAHFVSAYQGQQ